MLVDVGCSGGIDPGWRIFGDRLTAYGFDPSRHEISRLAASEPNPNVHYFNAFVGLPEGHPAKGAAVEPWRWDPWTRVSACRTQILQQQCAAAAAAAAPPRPAIGTQAPAAPESVVTPDEPESDAQTDLMQRNLWSHAWLADPDQPLVLPDFLQAQGVADVDFIKIDVDGADFEILQSLEDLLQRPGLLGAMLEVSFHGADDPSFNTFHNVDRFMRARGFDLFDLTVRKYSLACLPRPYLFRHPFAAQTVGGRPLQGDALYLRDPGHVHAGRDFASWSDDKLLKLGSLFCLFGLPDHAVEILLQFRERLSARLTVESALDMLTQEVQTLDADLWEGRGFTSYAEFISAYEADDPLFYGANDRRHDQIGRARLERDEAQADLIQAKGGLESALNDLGRCQAQSERNGMPLDQMQADRDKALQNWRNAETEIAAMRQSLSWRITAGLRAVRRMIGHHAPGAKES
jgi:hypothetical protein